VPFFKTFRGTVKSCVPSAAGFGLHIRLAGVPQKRLAVVRKDDVIGQVHFLPLAECSDREIVQ